jgi:hypothetical protein
VTPDPLGLVTRLGILKYLADQINAARKERLGPEATEAFPVGSRIPIMIGDAHAGFLSIPQPRKSAKVISEAKFLAWVRDKHPSEIVTEPRVRESFADLVLKSVRERGGWLDKATGELADVPGVERGEGDPFPVVDLHDNAGDVIAAAWQGHQAEFRELLALPAGDAP